MQKIQTAADRQDKIMNGTNDKIKRMEGFNDRGYKTSEVLNAKYAVQPTPDGLATAIQTHQITPLTQMAGDYNALMANINSEYNTIGTNVSAATSLRDNLKNNTRAGYLENNYDMVPPIKRVEDVRIDDINEMISQTNTAYTLATITAMTLIIAGIFVMRK
jgi:dTDP-glucose pyrophosphorylase